jgi:PPK2 family polyphosphate:nucleotide phosphotransferase
MKIKSDQFRVRPGQQVNLATHLTRVDPFYSDKDEYAKLLGKKIDELSRIQHMHYASDRYSVLLVFQAMDAAGKDGVIRHVLSGLNPQGCQVFSFKHPSATDLDHDFLWRTNTCLPERGRIGIFNRSYYEEVLIVRVHPEILRAQKLPEPVLDPGQIWPQRYRSINDMEAHLHHNGTRILKFFLHLSRDEQKKRFLERIDNPEKNWKFSEGDLHERAYWDEYMQAYEHCLGATSTAEAPWYVVPADDKENARLIIADIFLEMYRTLDLHYPVVSPARQQELQGLRARLESN